MSFYFSIYFKQVPSIIYSLTNLNLIFSIYIVCPIRIQFNKDSELEILSSYNDTIKYELESIRSEYQVLYNMYPISLKRIPEFDNLSQDNTWTKSINGSITTFKNIVKTFQNT